MSKVHKKGCKIVHRGLHALTPVKITVTKTGQSLNWADVKQELKDLINLENDVIESRLNDPDWTNRFTQALQAYRVTHDGKIPDGSNARKWAADNDLLIQVDKPKSWQASRLKEILTRKTITEYGAWVVNESQGEDQGDFKLGLTLDPAYTDNQYSVLEYDSDAQTSTLTMQVGSRKLNFHFQLPKRQLETLNVVGLVKPTVRETRQGEVVFDFKTKIEVPLFNRSGFKAGLDLGFVEPYVLTIINPEGKVVARYHASNITYKTMESLRGADAELRHLRALKYGKVQAYKSLGVSLEEQGDYNDFQVLCREVRRLAARVGRLKTAIAGLIGHEVREHLRPYHVRGLGVEYLGWLSGRKGKRAVNSSWAYGECQSALTNQLELIGVRVRRVSARDSSQLCNRCSKRVTHRGRTVVCSNGCLTDSGWDRDLNASVNLASRLRL